ncbi:hypothetical protein AYO22_08189 [Fonsecaea multimorphosa]|nr:hypothetical protein AYO22_08189 [Fonsecaea multimorphosa]
MKKPSARAPRTQPRMIGRSESCLDFVKEGVLVPLPAAAPTSDDVPMTGDDIVREDVAEDEPFEEVKGLVFGVLEGRSPKTADDVLVKAKEGDEVEEIRVEVTGADEVDSVFEKLESPLDVESIDVAVFCASAVDEVPSGEEFAVAEVADPAAAETAEAAEDSSELTSV